MAIFTRSESKFPIWIKSNGKWEPIPYHLMTTFEDDTKGFRFEEKEAPQIRDFIAKHKKYFRIKEVWCFDKYRGDYKEHRIIFTDKPRIIWRKNTRRVGYSLLIAGNIYNTASLVSGWWPLNGHAFVGLGIVIVGVILTMASIIKTPKEEYWL